MQDGTSGEQNHYFARSPGSRPVRSTFELIGPWGELRVESTSGVFSSTGLDKGTAVLLDHLGNGPEPAPPAGSHLLDLGCGSGVLAMVLASLYPGCSVHAVDVNPRALELCAHNATANGLSNITCSPPEQMDPGLRFHVIWSNPPIRIGKEQLHSLLEQWLARLHHDGRADLVVSRHLGADSLATWLTGRGHPVRRLGSAKGFRVLEVLPAR